MEFGPWTVKAGANDRDHNSAWLQYAPSILSHIKPLPVQKAGSLDDIQSAFDLVRTLPPPRESSLKLGQLASGGVRAQKLVLTL